MLEQEIAEEISEIEYLDHGTVDHIKNGRRLQLDHYNNHGLNFACIEANGIKQKLVRLEEPDIGRIYETLDASGGYSSACLGAASELMQKVVVQSLKKDGYVTDEVASLSRSTMLVNLFGPQGLWAEYFKPDNYHVAGRNSGSEGLELALRLVCESRFSATNLMQKTHRHQRNIILAFEGAWHGWTSGLINLLNRRHYSYGLQKFDPSDLKVIFLPFGDMELLQHFFNEHKASVLAVFVEPIQGDAGILVPPRGYLSFLSKTCKKYETILVADEVLTFAKTGQFFAMYDEEPIETDITVIGKNLGMGVLSVSMVIARRDFNIRPCGAVATSDLRPLACAVIDQGIKYIVNEKLLEKSKQLGIQLRENILKDLVNRFPQVYQEVRGIGFLNGIELTEKASRHLSVLRNCIICSGVYVEFMAGAGKRTGHHRYIYPTMRIAPPLISTEKEVADIVFKIGLATNLFIETVGC